MIGEQKGYSWLGWSKLQKLSFVEGFMTAATYLCDENLGLISKNYDEKKAREAIEALWNIEKNKSRTFSRDEVHQIVDDRINVRNSLLSNYDIVKIAVGQVADGLDAFYADFKNRQIRISDAVYVVKKQIKGAPTEEIEAICQWLRADKDFDRMTYKDKDGHFQYISFP